MEARPKLVGFFCCKNISKWDSSIGKVRIYNLHGGRMSEQEVAAQNGVESVLLRAFVGKRLWLDFVNSSQGVIVARRTTDVLDSFTTYIAWLHDTKVMPADGVEVFLKRAESHPSSASTALNDARRVRNALKGLAESAVSNPHQTNEKAISEINRILGRNVDRRIRSLGSNGKFTRSFIPAGEFFGGLLIPIIESAADSLVDEELSRVRKCPGKKCGQFFLDESRSGRKCWCQMRTCGNRAKAARHREGLRKKRNSSAL